MSNKIITLGNGFVAQHLPYLIVKDRLDLSSKHIEAVIDMYGPDAIVNCIGKTGRPNIDSCESNKSETVLANTALPILLAEVCFKKGIHMIHIGSGCIFYGESPIGGCNELDFANPLSFYSKTKYACDLAIGDMPNVTTLRIRMPISNKNHPRNLINKLINYKEIIDIQNSVTFMDDLVNVVRWVAKNSVMGMYHATNPDTLTAKEIMEEYQKYVPEHKFTVIDENKLNDLTIATRSNCILNSEKLRKDFYFPSAKEALKKCMKEYILQK